MFNFRVSGRNKNERVQIQAMTVRVIFSLSSQVRKLNFPHLSCGGTICDNSELTTLPESQIQLAACNSPLPLPCYPEVPEGAAWEG